mgnify:CR=1 FL=1
MSISWSEATASDRFVGFEEGENKELVIKEWKLEEVEKFGKKSVEFSAIVVEEDKKDMTYLEEPKLFTATSRRLKKALRPLLEDKDPKTPVRITVLKIGDKFDTQYSVKLLK